METPKQERVSLKSLGSIQRKAVSLSADSLIRTGVLSPGQPLPLVVTPAVDGLSLVEWTRSNLAWIENNLFQAGGILFRGFGIKSVADFEAVVGVYSEDLLQYVYRSTPRTQVSNTVYTSTEYPANQVIPFHNEMSYTRSWPMKIWFCCLKAAEQGGATPIADSRAVYRRLSPEIRDRFVAKGGVMYIRNYGLGVDLPWQDVFQTNDKAEVEAFCKKAGIAYEWVTDNHLRTRQVCQAVAKHPRTGEMLWFNQAHLFHFSSLDVVTRETLLASFKEEDLPRNTCYGDGSPLELSVLDEIRAVYEQERVAFPWQEGDVMILDNMLVAHARDPFEGARKVVVSMAEMYGETE